MRRVDHDCLGVGVKELANFVGVDGKVRGVERIKDRNAARHFDGWDVRVVVWLDDDDFFARVDEPHDGGKDGFGGTMDDVVSLNIFLSDIRYRQAAIDARREFFSAPGPSATVVGGVDFAFEDLLVEISAIAILGQ